MSPSISPRIGPGRTRGPTRREQATARYLELKGTGRTSNDVREVVLAAWDGRIDVLFVTVDVPIWGTLAPERRAIQIGNEAPGQNEDLSNLSAIRTILSRGTVYGVPQSELPDESPVAAVLRY